MTVLRLLATAALLLASATAVAAPVGSAVAAPASGTCSTSSESRQPVLLVHGFNSSAGTWDKSKGSFANARTCVATFDYGAESTNWVTDPAIGQRLAGTIHQLAQASRASGGTGKVIVVAHSMGGLATRCAVSASCGGGSPSDLRELITFGTPNHGTYLKSYMASDLSDLLGPYLSANYCFANPLSLIPGLCKEIKALGTSAAGKAFTPGSKQLDELPQLPGDIPDFAIAGSFPITTDLFLHTFTVGDIGDAVVARESALSEAKTDGGTGGTGALVPCGTFDLVTNAVTFHCWHGTETSYSGFIDQAQTEITKIEGIDGVMSRTTARPNDRDLDADAAAFGEARCGTLPIGYHYFAYKVTCARAASLLSSGSGAGTTASGYTCNGGDNGLLVCDRDVAPSPPAVLIPVVTFLAPHARAVRAGGATHQGGWSSTKSWFLAALYNWQTANGDGGSPLASSYFSTAANDLYASSNATYYRVSGVLQSLAALPDAGLTPKEQATAATYLDELNKFFGTHY